MDILDQLEALAIAGSGDSRALTIAQLEFFLDIWNRTGKMPSEAGVLSSGEYCALMVAAGREDLLGRSPVGAFMMLDGWLQKWVMETRGWKALIGSRIGV